MYKNMMINVHYFVSLQLVLKILKIYYLPCIMMGTNKK